MSEMCSLAFLKLVLHIYTYFQSKVVKNCCSQVVHTKPLHRYNSTQVDGTEMQNALDGNYHIIFKH